MESELIVRAKEHQGLTSYSELARRLGCSRQLVNDVKNGRAHFTAETMGLLAELAGKPWQEVMPEYMAETAKRPEVRAFWMGKLGRVTTMISIVVAIAVTGFQTLAPTGFVNEHAHNV